MEPWSRRQLNAMSSDELRALVIETPLRDDYRIKQDEYYLQIGNHSDVSRYYDTLVREYKDALEHFKRLSVNADGTKAKMTPEIRAARKLKEHSYRIQRRFLNGVFSERRNILQTAENTYQEAWHKYAASREYFVIAILDVRERAELQRQCALEEYERNRAKIVKETVVQLSRVQLDETMDDVCIICMEPHTIGDTVLTCCGHRFGQDCFHAWAKHRHELNRGIQCAMCKKDHPSVTKYEEKARPIIIDLCNV
jgi:hypothetical protein